MVPYLSHVANAIEKSHTMFMFKNFTFNVRKHICIPFQFCTVRVSNIFFVVLFLWNVLQSCSRFIRVRVWIPPSGFPPLEDELKKTCVFVFFPPLFFVGNRLRFFFGICETPLQIIFFFFLSPNVVRRSCGSASFPLLFLSLWNLTPSKSLREALDGKLTVAAVSWFLFQPPWEMCSIFELKAMQPGKSGIVGLGTSFFFRWHVKTLWDAWF